MAAAHGTLEARQTVLCAEFTALPGRTAEVANLISRYRNEVRRAPGTVSFAVHRKREQPDTFFVYERYATEEDFQAHLTGPESAVFNAALKGLVKDDGSLLTFLEDI